MSASEITLSPEWLRIMADAGTSIVVADIGAIRIEKAA